MSHSTNGLDGREAAEAESVSDAAQRYHAAGLAPIPPVPGQKRPLSRWEQYQDKPPLIQTVRSWFDRRQDRIGLICGAASGNLEVLDFDIAGDGLWYEAWVEAVDDPDLIGRLVVAKSQSGGRHVYYRCSDPVPGWKKLAYGPTTIAECQAAKARGEAAKLKASIETRGQGSYIVCPPTPGYELLAGDLAELPVLTPEERQHLIDAARSLDHRDPPKKAAPAAAPAASEPKPSRNGTAARRRQKAVSDVVADAAAMAKEAARRRWILTPIDDFNDDADVASLLEPLGWTFKADVGEQEYWIEPGATTDNHGAAWHKRLRRLKVWSGCGTVDPNEDGQAYTRFDILAAAKHGGDQEAAYRDIVEQGFGTPRTIGVHGGGEGGGYEAEAGDEPDLIIAPSADWDVIGELILRDQHLDDAGRCLLRRFREQWHRFERGAYRPLPDEDFDAELRKVLSRVVIPDNKGVAVPLRRTISAVREVGRAMAAASVDGTPVLVPTEAHPPLWLGDEHPVPASRAVPCRNLIVDAATGATIPATPHLFTPAGVPFDFDPDAPEPSFFLAWLEDILAGDSQAVALIQEWFGLCTTADTSFQRMLVLVGPTRSGKSTLCRVLSGIIGEGNVASMSSAGMAGAHALEQCVGKLALLLPDLRIRGSSGQMLQDLLSIVGEDPVTINPKHRRAYAAVLRTRVTIASNEIPSINDPSGALAARMVTLKTPKSFAGREDPSIERRIQAELPSILKWSLAGYRRLRDRGHFVEPASSLELRRQVESFADEVRAFVEEECRLEPDLWVECGTLYERYQEWCRRNGYEHPKSKQHFGRSLTFLGVERARPRQGAERSRVYLGVVLA